MSSVFLVSCQDVQNDADNIYLQDALTKRGIDVSIVKWEDPSVDYSRPDLVISRTTSNYVFNPTQFFNWARKVEQTTTLWNKSQAMEWNHHKRYLLDLQSKQVPIPETILIPQNTEKSIEEVLEIIPWDDFIVKPCLGVGSSGLRRFTKDSTEFESHFRDLNRYGYYQEYSWREFDFLPCDTLVQPYIPEITKVGEASLLYYGGEYSHSVVKRVKPGDYRAHPVWGAEVLRYESSDEEVEVGYKTLEASGHETDFARLDMIPAMSGPILIEVELIDPVMFFEIHPKTAESYADHIENFLNR